MAHYVSNPSPGLPRHLFGLVALTALAIGACSSPSDAVTDPDASVIDTGDTATSDVGGSDGSGPDAGPECVDNTDCRGGEVCRDGECLEVCSATAPCDDANLVCDEASGFCVDCLIDEDCTAPQVCDEAARACIDPECSTDGDCPGGFECSGGSCVSIDDIICEPNTTRCDGDQVLLCSRDGTRETATACAEAQLCAVIDGVGACRDVVCTPNAVGCADAFTASLCDPLGVNPQLFPCAEAQYCFDGACLPQVCEPNASACESGSVVSCDERGASEQVTVCADQLECLAGDFGCTCADASCEVRACAPESAQCVGNARRACLDDGLRWGALEPCSDDELCVAGACLPVLCAPGSEVCSGETLLTCGDDGTTRTETDCTATGRICTGEGGDGACTLPVCNADEAVCAAEGEAVELCDARGATFSTTACDADEFCNGGACLAQTCLPGSAAICIGGDAQACDARGSGYQVVDDCSGSEVCVGGQCRPIICTASSVRCDGERLRVCSADGTVETITDCAASAEWCSAAASSCRPRVCTPGSAAVCRDGDVQSCNSNGSGYNLVADCATFACVDGVCDYPCGPDSALLGTVCVAGTGGCAETGTYVCNAGNTDIECSVTGGVSSAEICDNVDNDCDSSVDESLSQACYTGPGGTAGVGICRNGSQVCATGTWGTCVGQVLPATEICDNINNDCDGATDEGVTRACYTGPSGTSGVGACRTGTQTCAAGVWGSTCSGQVVPATERCNGADDDCDGTTDEGFGGSSGQFRVTDLTDANCNIVDHEAASGDDRGALVVGNGYAYTTGDSATAYVTSAIGPATSVGVVHDGLASNLRTGDVYALATSTGEVGTASPTSVTRLLALSQPGLTTTSTITLSTAIPINGYNGVGIFSGWDRIVVHTGVSVYSIALPSGTTTNLGAMPEPSHSDCETWAYWGIAETTSTGTALVYVSNDGSTVQRSTVASTPIVTPVAVFPDLSDACAIGADPRNDRWYFDYEYTGYFGGLNETIGACDAIYTLTDGEPALGSDCSVGVGACATPGVVECSADGGSTTCDAVAGTPTTETCNGIDDDCDGTSDETWRSADGAFFSDGSDGAFAPLVDTVLAPGIYNFTTINIPAGVTVTTNGSGVLELYASSVVTIAGTVNVSGARGGNSTTVNDCSFAPFGTGGATANPNAPGTDGALSCAVAALGGLGAAGFSSSGSFFACVNPGGAFGGGSGGNLCEGGGGGGGYAGGGGGGGYSGYLAGRGASFAGGVGGAAGTSSSTAGGGGGGGAGTSVYGGGAGGSSTTCDSYPGGGGGGGAIGADAVADLAMLTTFRPGSAGGGGGGVCTCDQPGGGGGGGGGGALRIASAVSVTVTPSGVLRANGGNGGTSADGSGGGGGGSGGAIHIWAPTVAVAGSVTAAPGGGGTTGGCGTNGGAGGVGRIKVSAATSQCSLTGTFNPTLVSGCTPSGSVVNRTFVEALVGDALGFPCTVGVGACTRTGTRVCAAGGASTTCSAVAGSPSAEVCGNSVDENCDGVVCP